MNTDTSQMIAVPPLYASTRTREAVPIFQLRRTHRLSRTTRSAALPRANSHARSAIASGAATAITPTASMAASM